MIFDSIKGQINKLDSFISNINDHWEDEVSAYYVKCLQVYKEKLNEANKNLEYAGKIIDKIDRVCQETDTDDTAKGPYIKTLHR